MAEDATDGKLRFLVCIDGTDESYRGAHYAAEYGPEHDICLCYVRPMDRGLRSGGLNVRIARQNMLTWGLELPGIQYLKKGRGYSEVNLLEKFARDSKILDIFEGTQQIQQLIIARNVLGKSSSELK